jgi:hypothetical protein
VSQAITVARFATRELWMTFRLLLVLLVSVGAGAVVGLLPAPLPETTSRLAGGFGVAVVVAAAVAAWSLAEERLSGRAGWLITRSVARATYLFGWYGALLIISASGLVAGALLGWLAIPGGSMLVDATEYVVAIAGVAATLGLALAVGLLAGAILRPRGAMIVTVALGAAAALATILLPSTAPWLPGGALAALARAADAEPVVNEALRAGGICLALAAAVLVACRLALERADL